MRDKIRNGQTALGIEFGSTRIKAVLIDDENKPLAQGAYSWENKYENGIWTYSLEEIENGLRGCYADLKRDVSETYDVKLTKVGAIGISAMMHGYVPLDRGGNLLTPFRTWRNNLAARAAEKLTALFGFNIPARWSIAHLYYSLLSGEPFAKDIATLTTLAGYMHRRLTGRSVVGIGEASGIVPIDAKKKCYDEEMLRKFNAEAAKYEMPWRIEELLPEILLAGENAGYLTDEGARLLDPSGDLQSGIPFCPPEGDAETGMVATNSIAPRTCNVSAGTSIFGMAVLERPLKRVHPELDIVATPMGDAVAMAHCNNCTSDINAWTEVFGEVVELFGSKPSKDELYTKLFTASLSGEPDCGDLLVYNYFSGEHITKVQKGRPLVVRTPNSRFTLANFIRAELYSAMATLKLGFDIMQKDEGVALDSICAHGGLFKTAGVCENYLASALNAPVTVMKTAGEGGAYGMALLAGFARSGQKDLAEYLDKKVFASEEKRTVLPDEITSRGIAEYIAKFARGLAVVNAAEREVEE